MSRHDFSAEEQRIIQQINAQTQRENQNNLTRTEAYLRFYKQYPEIHWAYVAHMVSRNGGWNMTDLAGEVISRLLKRRRRLAFFLFLERCNWLIFQDVYPQLLLYAESIRRQKPLFHLLPVWNISVFMQKIWPWYWQNRDERLLAYALILNEQFYIEKRVVQHQGYEQHVLRHPAFKLQSWIHFNQVYCPYRDQQTGSERLAGTIMNDFSDVMERIRVGKHLYAILFELGDISNRIWTWAKQTPHTASRADYWPQLFTPQRSPLPMVKSALRHQPEHENRRPAPYTARLAGDRLHKGQPPLYSPVLGDVWPESCPHRSPGALDWFHAEQQKRVSQVWKEPIKARPYDMTDEYIFALNRMEGLVWLKEKWTLSPLF